jgi:anti-sigma28 factor (negative regulator of flagellin synthesis)
MELRSKLHGNGDVLPKTIIDKVSELRQQIIDGTLKVEIYVPE